MINQRWGFVEEGFAEMPILEEIAAQLRETGTVEQELTDRELADVMSAVFEQLVLGQQGVKADIAGMSVQIEYEQGTFSGDVEVEAPIKANIRGNCIMANDETPGTIQLRFPLMSINKAD